MLNKYLLRAVARASGFQCSYRNVDGNYIWSPEKTLIKLIETAANIKINSNADLEKIFKQKKEELYDKKIKPCQVLWNGVFRPIHFYSKEKLTKEIIAKIYYENRSNENITFEVISEKNTDQGFHYQLLSTKKLEVGYHELVFQINNLSVKTFLICPPEKLSIKNEKQWGPFVPLYALRSDTDWGIGSFKEAKELASLLKNYGASWMGLLPMLAGNFDGQDCDPSPYSSLSRLFWNEIYLDVEALVEKYDHKESKNIINSETFQLSLSTLRGKTHVDYYAVYAIKKQILLMLSDSFFENNENTKEKFVEFTKKNPDIFNYAKFRSENLREQRFHIFVQYEMNNVLESFEKENNIGLYMDYPVGVNDAGFDFREYRNVFFGEVSVGAPPEPVFALGQDWGFPAFHPQGMQNDQYTYFRKSLQHHLKFCKILRLDHIMGLHRIYSVPKKFKGDEGVYLRFPPEELFAVVILEAYRAGADLIGENLGTVPLSVDKIIKERNLNGMWVLQCETWRNPKEAFKAIPTNSLVCLNTHDMPMLDSFKKGSDLSLVHSLKILSKSYKDKFEIERKNQIEVWEKEFTKESFLTHALTEIAKSSAKYFVVNLEDLWKEIDPQNIPGTWKEYPNWRRKFKFKNSEIINNETVKYLAVLKEFRDRKC